MGLFGLYWASQKSLRRLCQTYLDPGERIDHLLVGYRSLVMPRWLIAVTDRRILVIEADINPRSGITRPFRDVPRTVLPRSTRLGPIYGSGWILLDGERVFIPMSKKKIAAIDAAAGFPPTTDR